MSRPNKFRQRRVAELGVTNRLFGLLDGYVECMWHDGPVQAEWVAEALGVIAAPPPNVSGDLLAPAEFQSRLQQQKLLVHLSNVINQVTSEYPGLFTLENIQEALSTIAAWIRNQY